MGSRRFGTAGVFLALALAFLLGAQASVAQQRAPFRGLPWGPPPAPADPLEPWSLENQPLSVPEPVSPETVQPGLALPRPPDPLSPRDPRLDVPPPASGLYGSDSTAADAIPVVLLRQILIDNPNQARQLRELFDAGVRWDAAKPLLALGDVPETTREYPLEDLADPILQEIDALPDSAWSSGHPWRGRTMFFQVLARAQRSRAALPSLGQGLSDQERARLSNLRPNLRKPVLSGLDNRDSGDADLVPVSIIKQEPPVYPEAATTDGEVTLVVYIGRQGDVTRIDVASSTDPIFEQPAIAAARTSVYTSATRNGVPEPGVIRLTYPFKVSTAPVAESQP